MTFDPTYRGDPRGMGPSEAHVMQHARSGTVEVDEHGRIPMEFNGRPSSACATCGRFGPHQPTCPNGGHKGAAAL